MAAVHLRFGLPVGLDKNIADEIKQADQIAAYLEATQLAGFSLDEAALLFGRPRGLSGQGFKQFLALQPLAPTRAAALYMARFEAVS